MPGRKHKSQHAAAAQPVPIRRRLSGCRFTRTEGSVTLERSEYRTASDDATFALVGMSNSIFARPP